MEEILKEFIEEFAPVRKEVPFIDNNFIKLRTEFIGSALLDIAMPVIKKHKLLWVVQMSVDKTNLELLIYSPKWKQ
jgi:hypothetical protein